MFAQLAIKNQKKKTTTIDSFFTRISSPPKSQHTAHPQADQPCFMSLRSNWQREIEKGKDREFHGFDGSGGPEEQSTMVQGGIPGLRVGETGLEHNSITEDEEELGEALGRGFGGHKGGPSRHNMYPHLYDLQDLNLYPSQYDHGFSQTYANLLH